MYFALATIFYGVLSLSKIIKGEFCSKTKVGMLSIGLPLPVKLFATDNTVYTRHVFLYLFITEKE